MAKKKRARRKQSSCRSGRKKATKRKARKRRSTKEDKLKRLRVTTLRRRLTEAVIKKTATFKKKFYSKKVKISKRAKDITKALEGRNFGCYASAVQELVEAIIQEPLKDEIEFTTGVAVVPLKKKHYHNYTCRKVCLLCNNRYAVKQNGNTGLTLPRMRDYFRPATESEIIAFVSDLPKEEIVFHFASLL